MTAIAIWRNDEMKQNPSLWAVADSKISGAENTQLIGDAVKILSLPIICRRPGPEGFYSEVYFVHTLGYCFAGSTLMGQNAYLGILPLLSNIVSSDSYIPSLNDISSHILAYLKRTFDDYKSVAAKRSLFEVAIFGYCARSERLEIFHFRPVLVNGVFEMTVTPNQSLKEHDFLYMGDKHSELENEIARAFADKETVGRPVDRAPRYVIADRIADRASVSIGGDLQLAIVDKFGFRPLALGKTYVEGEPKAYISYLGRELTNELTMIGEAQTSLAAIF